MSETEMQAELSGCRKNAKLKNKDKADKPQVSEKGAVSLYAWPLSGHLYKNNGSVSSQPPLIEAHRENEAK